MPGYIVVHIGAGMKGTRCDFSPRQAQLTGEAALAFQPSGFAADGDAAFLDAAMALGEVSEAVEAVLRCVHQRWATRHGSRGPSIPAK